MCVCMMKCTVDHIRHSFIKTMQYELQGATMDNTLAGIAVAMKSQHCNNVFVSGMTTGGR